jgi:hypothetical protein
MNAKLIGSAVAMAFAVGGCATTGPDAASVGATAPHNHMRDAKQGYAASPVAAAPAPKPLHNHREFK